MGNLFFRKFIIWKYKNLAKNIPNLIHEKNKNIAYINIFYIKSELKINNFFLIFFKNNLLLKLRALQT